ncbi:unnamed protein product [Musa hybrid cultivar]
MSAEDNADSLPSCIASVEKIESSEATTVEVCLDDATNYKQQDMHRWSGKYEAHLWDNTCRLEGRRCKGKQGRFFFLFHLFILRLSSSGFWCFGCNAASEVMTQEKAARAYDIAPLKYWGIGTKLNFQVCNYEKELEDIKNMTREECSHLCEKEEQLFFQRSFCL